MLQKLTLQESAELSCIRTLRTGGENWYSSRSAVVAQIGSINVIQVIRPGQNVIDHDIPGGLGVQYIYLGIALDAARGILSFVADIYWWEEFFPAISNRPYTVDPMYEVVFKHEGTGLRKRSGGSVVCQVSEDHILFREYEYIACWLAIAQARSE